MPCFTHNQFDPIAQLIMLQFKQSRPPF